MIRKLEMETEYLLNNQEYKFRFRYLFSLDSRPVNLAHIINNERLCIIMKLINVLVHQPNRSLHSDRLYAPTCLSVKCKHPISPLNWHGSLRYTVGMTTSEDWNDYHMTQPRLSTDKAREHNHFFRRGRLHSSHCCTKIGANNKMFCANYPRDIQ